jgi:uncharacterized membrane protein
MKIIIFTLLGLVLLGGIVLILLPDVKTVNITKKIPFQKELVWKKMRDLKNQTNWRAEVKEVKILSESPESWVEILKTGQEIKLKTVKVEEMNYWEMESFDGNLFDTNWKGKLNSISEKETEISFTETFKMKSTFSKIFFYLFLNLENLIHNYIDSLENSLSKGQSHEKK